VYLLDTSALLAHCLNEPGAGRVKVVILEGNAYVAAVSWLELSVRLKQLNTLSGIVEMYRATLAGTIPISSEIALLAVRIKAAAGERLPAMDALIAAAAAANGFVLIHRDQHFESIPTTGLQQEMLSNQ
jgi:predicted nucleic acid-binding protein